MQDSPGMSRVGRCWGRGKSRETRWQHGELSPRQRAQHKREIEILPSSRQNKESLAKHFALSACLSAYSGNKGICGTGDVLLLWD